MSKNDMALDRSSLELFATCSILCPQFQQCHDSNSVILKFCETL